MLQLNDLHSCFKFRHSRLRIKAQKPIILMDSTVFTSPTTQIWQFLRIGQNCFLPHYVKIFIQPAFYLKLHHLDRWSLKKSKNNQRKLTGPLLYGIFNSFFIFSASDTTSTSPTQSGNMWAIRKLQGIKTTWLSIETHNPNALA